MTEKFECGFYVAAKLGDLCVLGDEMSSDTPAHVQSSALTIAVVRATVACLDS